MTKVTKRAGQFKFAGEPVTRMKQLSTPGDRPRRRRRRHRRADAGFFQSNRKRRSPDGNRPSTLQALLMTSSKVVNDRVLADKGAACGAGRVAQDRTIEMIEELYLTTMARRPTPRRGRWRCRRWKERSQERGAGEHAVGAAQQPRIPGQSLNEGLWNKRLSDLTADTP